MIDLCAFHDKVSFATFHTIAFIKTVLFSHVTLRVQAFQLILGRLHCRDFQVFIFVRSTAPQAHMSLNYRFALPTLPHRAHSFPQFFSGSLPSPVS